MHSPLRRPLRLMFLALSTAVAPVLATAAVPSFRGLGHLLTNERNTWGLGISGDGMTVIGRERRSGGVERPFIWTASTGMLDFGSPPGETTTRLSSVSNDGQFIACDSGRPYVWSASVGFTMISSSGGSTSGISGDGGMVVGITADSLGNTVGYRWSASTGMTLLPNLPGDGSGYAFGISRDGSTVVGRSQGANQTAVKWTPANGVVSLGDLPGGSVFSSAGSANADGTVIVGQSNSANGPEAFRWTASGGMVGLGDLPGGTFESDARDISDDGNVIVGIGVGADYRLHATVWTPAAGMRDLRTMLTQDFGLNLTDWSSLDEAYAVSADGTRITGYGTHDGAWEPYVATFPEPSSMLLLGAAAMLLSRRCRSRRQ